MDKNKRKNWLKAFIKIVVSASALYFIFTKIEFGEVLSVLQSSNILLLFLAWMVFILSKLISSFRLNLFFHTIGIPLSSGVNIRLYLLGMFYNLFLPGGIGGDGYKVYLLNQHYKTPVKKLIWVVFLDRVSGMVALGFLALLLGGFLKDFDRYRYLSWVAVLLSIPVLYVVIKRFVKEFHKIMGKITLQSFWVQLSQVVSVIFILVSFHQQGDYAEYITVFLVSSIVAILPITIGGAGAREVTFLLGAKYLHLDVNIAISLSLTFYVITVLTSLIGFYYVVRPVKFNGDLPKTPVH